MKEREGGEPKWILWFKVPILTPAFLGYLRPLSYLYWKGPIPSGQPDCLPYVGFVIFSWDPGTSEHAAFEDCFHPLEA